MKHSDQDWLGLRADFLRALAHPTLEACAVEGVMDAMGHQSAYRIAAILGECRLFGVSLGEFDGTLPIGIALAAAQYYGRRLADWRGNARQLARCWEETDGEVEGKELVLQLLEARMEAWAVLVALDEAYQDALDDSSPHCTELREMVDRLVDEVELLDEELRRDQDLLSLAAGTELLANWRRLLVEPYRLLLPWWLDGTLEATAKCIWEEAIRWLPAPNTTVPADPVVQFLRDSNDSLRDEYQPSQGIAAASESACSPSPTRAMLHSTDFRVAGTEGLMVCFDQAVNARQQKEWRVFLSSHSSDHVKDYVKVVVRLSGGTTLEAPVRAGCALIPQGDLPSGTSSLTTEGILVVTADGKEHRVVPKEAPQ